MRKRRRTTANPPHYSPRRRPTLEEIDDDDEEAQRRYIETRRDYDEEDEEEMVCAPAFSPLTDNFDEEGNYRDLDLELLQALCWVENYSHSLQRERTKVARLIRDNPQLAVKWREFTSQGGIGAKDFEHFLSGKFRCRLTRGKKHLRLVSSRNPPPIRLRRHQDDDPDEAA